MVRTHRGADPALHQQHREGPDDVGGADLAEAVHPQLHGEDQPALVRRTRVHAAAPTCEMVTIFTYDCTESSDSSAHGLWVDLDMGSTPAGPTL